MSCPDDEAGRQGGPHPVAPAGRCRPVSPGDERVRALVERERWMRSAAGAPRARPPADVAYRLAAWYGVEGVTAGQVAQVLLAGR